MSTSTDNSVRQFRAVKNAKNPKTFDIETSIDGTNWLATVANLESALVDTQFRSLQAYGKKIVDTKAYKFKRK